MLYRCILFLGLLSRSTLAVPSVLKIEQDAGGRVAELTAETKALEAKVKTLEAELLSMRNSLKAQSDGENDDQRDEHEVSSLNTSDDSCPDYCQHKADKLNKYCATYCPNPTELGGQTGTWKWMCGNADVGDFGPDSFGDQSHISGFRDFLVNFHSSDAFKHPHS
jgi:hypothetical protein